MDAATLGFLSFTGEFHQATVNTQATPTIIGSSFTSANSWGTGIPTTLAGRVCDNTTAGAMTLPNTAPHLGSTGYRLSRYRFVILSGVGNLVCLDRLVDYAGADATSTSAQILTPQVLTRYTSGLGNQLYFEVNAASASAVSTTVTVSYTNELGIAGRSAVITLPASWGTATRTFMIPLQSGDRGVRAVASMTFGSASPNAGNNGIVIAHPLGMMTSGVANIINGTGGTPFRDITSHCWKPILQNACMYATYMASGSGTGVSQISYALI